MHLKQSNRMIIRISIFRNSNNKQYIKKRMKNRRKIILIVMINYKSLVMINNYQMIHMKRI